MPYADTLKVYEKLREGFDEKEAKTIASAIEEAFESNNKVLLERIATKEDLANLRAEIYRAMILQAGVIIGAVVALLKLLS